MTKDRRAKAAARATAAQTGVSFTQARREAAEQSSDWEHTRVYLRKSKVAHQLGFLASPNDGYPACVRCGRAPVWPEGWFGTGSMTEQETAASMRLCVRTFRS